MATGKKPKPDFSSRRSTLMDPKPNLGSREPSCGTGKAMKSTGQQSPQSGGSTRGPASG